MCTTLIFYEESCDKEMSLHGQQTLLSRSRSEVVLLHHYSTSTVKLTGLLLYFFLIWGEVGEGNDRCVM